MRGRPAMKRLLPVHLSAYLVLALGCGGAAPSLTPDELAKSWEKHKGQMVVLSGTPKFVVAEKKLALFDVTGGNYRISAEVAEGFEKLKSGQTCRLSGKVKGIEVKTIVVEDCKVLP